ncbi:hypothetical protein BC828DRAFT_395622 [Blastocladiella britannica]|nr:hypothetical protein BC828DRAFT_395622 [Blastocladiella britannica]
MIDHAAYIILARAADASHTPEEALTVLNVLPKSRAPSVLAAVLSRGFLQHEPWLAVKHGHGLALLPHYPFHILFDAIRPTICAAGTLGSIAALDLLWQLLGPQSAARMVWFTASKRSMVNEAIRHGHVQVFGWVSRVASAAGIPVKWSSLIWSFAAQGGHTKIIHWAIERVPHRT